MSSLKWLSTGCEKDSLARIFKIIISGYGRAMRAYCATNYLFLQYCAIMTHLALKSVQMSIWDECVSIEVQVNISYNVA